MVEEKREKQTGKSPMMPVVINDLFKKLEDSVALRDAATKDIAEVTANIVQAVIADGRGDLININLDKVCREYGIPTPNFMHKPKSGRRSRVFRE